MSGHHDLSAATDEQWALIEPLIPVYPGGRLRTICPVSAVGGGTCPPTSRPGVPSRRHPDEWRHDDTLEAIHDPRRRKVRTREEPCRPRTTASVDSRSVETTGGREARGRDNHKEPDGRKRHIVVDGMSLLLTVLVTSAAAVGDGVAAREWFARLDGPPISQVQRMFGESKDHNDDLCVWVEANADHVLTIIRRPDEKEGWFTLPVRWAVERTFAWPGRDRRLSKDRERSARSSGAMVRPATNPMMLDRPEPPDRHGEFCYRMAA